MVWVGHVLSQGVVWYEVCHSVLALKSIVPASLEWLDMTNEERDLESSCSALHTRRHAILMVSDTSNVRTVAVIQISWIQCFRA